MTGWIGVPRPELRAPARFAALAGAVEQLDCALRSPGEGFARPRSRRASSMQSPSSSCSAGPAQLLFALLARLRRRRRGGRSPFLRGGRCSLGCRCGLRGLGCFGLAALRGAALPPHAALTSRAIAAATRIVRILESSRGGGALPSAVERLRGGIGSGGLHLTTVVALKFPGLSNGIRFRILASSSMPRWPSPASEDDDTTQFEPYRVDASGVHTSETGPRPTSRTLERAKRLLGSIPIDQLAADFQPIVNLTAARRMRTRSCRAAWSRV